MGPNYNKEDIVISRIIIIRVDYIHLQKQKYKKKNKGIYKKIRENKIQ